MDRKDQIVEEKHTEEATENNSVAAERGDGQNELSNGEPELEGRTEAPRQDDLQSQLAAAKEQASDYYERLLRVSAEFENYKKRTAREMRETIKFANEKLAKELLTVVDNLERAIESAANSHSEDDPLLQGVILIHNEMLKILAMHQVTPIFALGEPFDPNFHQAMMQAESEAHPPNTVIDEFQKGYMIHERLLRPSMVTVSKNTDVKVE